MHLEKATVLALIGCTGNNTSINISPKISENYSDQGRTAIFTDMTSYLNNYGCGVSSIDVKIGNAPDIGPETMATGDSVIVDFYIPSKNNPDYIAELSRTARHEAAHACVNPNSFQRFAQPYKLYSATPQYAVGIEGFDVIVEFDGKSTAFRKIEEGVAEYLAAKSNPDTHIIDSPDYYGLAIVTQFLAAKYFDGNSKNMSSLLHESKLLEFAGTITGNSNPDMRDVETIMQLYNLIYDATVNSENPDPVISFIINGIQKYVSVEGFLNSVRGQ